jgi:cytosine/adenosine deaminase-related metal-dependent hydrolase
MARVAADAPADWSGFDEAEFELSTTTAGLVCGHHHLYSALARGMPAPPRRPSNFMEILEQIWWRVDQALDLDMLRWSAMLGALEALESGTTAIVDHHESPNAIEGSLSVIADSCASVGVRVCTAYGVTDRHGADGARRGLAENERFLRDGGRGMVGVHAAFTCSESTLRSAAALAVDLGVGVHVHVAEDGVDTAAGARLEPLARDDWLLAHCVHLDRPLPGTIAHNPRSNMNNAVGYARPATRPNPVVLGTDGIGGDVLEEFRLAYARHREDDVQAEPDTAWRWLHNGYGLFPEAAEDVVVWDSDHADDPWWVAYTPGVRPVDVTVAGEVVLRDRRPTRVDAPEIRAKAAEQAARLFARL